MSHHDERVKALWLEYRVAAQFDQTWDRVESCVALAHLRESFGELPSLELLAALRGSSRSGGSPAYWIQQVEIPTWFVRDHLGIGSGRDIFDTQRTLSQDNARRRRQYKQQIEQLRKAAQAGLEPSEI